MSCSVRVVWFSRLSLPPVGVPVPGGFVSLLHPRAAGQSHCAGEGWEAGDRPHSAEEHTGKRAGRIPGTCLGPGSSATHGDEMSRLRAGA